MRIKQGFEIKKVFEQYIVVATGELSKSFHGIIKLNRTGYEIWSMIDKGLSKEQITRHLVDKYSIKFDKASSDVEIIVQQMVEANVIEKDNGD